MSDKEWETLFELIEKVCNLPGMSATERGELIREKAQDTGAGDTWLEEFCVCVDMVDDDDEDDDEE